MNNVFGTSPEGIAVSVQRLLATKPQHGGVMVEQANALNNSVYRAADGWNVEVVGGVLNPNAHVYITARGGNEYGPFGVELFTHVGCEMPTAAELEAARLADEQRRSDEAIEAAMAWLVAEEDDTTDVYDKCSNCRAELSLTRGVVYKYPDGSLACGRCAMSEMAKSA